MTVLVTGAAGFIGYHVSEALIARGDAVIGVDNVNDYYDPRLKEARLARLARHKGFRLVRADISDRTGLPKALGDLSDVEGIVHLAAQAGVRYSLTNPFAYVDANLVGHTVLLELARGLKRLKHMVYASSSSVYGGNTKLPFSVEDRVDQPISLYAATKKANELMGHAYAHLFRIPLTGLRFFTVYGPWGRPDMALYLFSEAILAGKPIRVFNHGQMRRDFTYVDDIVAGVLAALDRPPAATPDGPPPQRIYNLGNHRGEDLLRVIGLLETALGRKAERLLEPLQPGDVPETFADIAASERDLGFHPRVTVDEGIPRFVAWFRAYKEGRA
ncbi:MAG: NAD-dependent epimerase/dehydratase family protein [Alphaproteobacteria bacterium]|nr:NAD-dependent epimerase/dehydratase family protein [Alphaproteobacteria bacterium]